MSIIKSALAKDLSDIYAPGKALGGTNATFSTLINPLLKNILIVSGLAAFLALIISGFSYITAAGDKAKLENAARMLNYAITGLVVIVAAYLLTIIVGSLVNINLFNI